MSIGSLSQTSQRSSPSAVELEAQRIGAAIEHIGTHGNLDGFHAGRAERTAPARAEARGIPAAPDARPNAVTAAAISPSNALPSEHVATALPAGRGDPPANAGVHNGEAARSLAGAIGSEPELVTSAAQKSIA